MTYKGLNGKRSHHEILTILSQIIWWRPNYIPSWILWSKIFNVMRYNDNLLLFHFSSDFNKCIVVWIHLDCIFWKKYYEYHILSFISVKHNNIPMNSLIQRTYLSLLVKLYKPYFSNILTVLTVLTILII
jgi:hypothetical protein